MAVRAARTHLFFALWPDAAVRGACDEAARDLRVRMQPRGHRSAPERYHLTLQYLDENLSDEVVAAARQAATQLRSPPFTLQLDHAGWFRGADVWWLGTRETPAALLQLHQRLRETLQRTRVPLDRARLTPHLTIHRGAGMPLPPTLIAPIEWAVRDFVLIRSHPGRQPVVYEQLGCWPLDPSAPIQAPEPDQLSLL
jgi:RNA 2',3'-cyclic 3'-phosphodiesterase